MAIDQHLLGPFVRRFLLEDVLADRNLSINTQRSYRDAIRLLFGYLADRHATDPVHVNVEQVTADVVCAFLAHLEDHRGNSVATRNQRLAALHSLFRFIIRQVPELVEHAAQVQAIPVRRTVTPTMSYLEKHEIDALLTVPDRRRAQGRRDYALLLFLYNTGARASEAAAVTIADITLDMTPSVRLFGKGRKIRLCPLWPHTVDVLRKLIGDRVGGAQVDPVFLNVRGQRITRYGVRALVIRATDRAVATAPSLKKKRVSPHTIRHTTAVHLLRAGVDINTIRAWLGHASLETTNRYAQIDLEMKAEALETCSVREGESVASTVPSRREDSELLAFLTAM